MEGLTDCLQNVKIIISEVEGVLTNGVFPIDELGNVPFKNFYHKDFEAINLLRRHFKLVFISGDNKINYNLFRSKQIPFYYEPKKKKQALLQALKRYSLTPDQAIYIGSTYSDTECMRQIPLAVCPEDAVPEIKNLSITVLPIFGGDGVLCHLYEFLKPEIHRRISK